MRPRDGDQRERVYQGIGLRSVGPDVRPAVDRAAAQPNVGRTQTDASHNGAHPGADPFPDDDEDELAALAAAPTDTEQLALMEDPP